MTMILEEVYRHLDNFVITVFPDLQLPPIESVILAGTVKSLFGKFACM